MVKVKKERANKYDEKVKTDKTFLQLIRLAVNPKPKQKQSVQNKP